MLTHILTCHPTCHEKVTLDHPDTVYQIILDTSQVVVLLFGGLYRLPRES